MESCSPVNTLIVPSSKLSFGGVPFTYMTLYCSIVGGLKYLTLTHLDFAYEVNKVSQLMHCPIYIYWVAVKRILRYLKGSLAHGLFFSRRSTTLHHGYTDYDWDEILMIGNPPLIFLYTWVTI